MIYNLFICWSQNSLSRESVWVPTLLPSPPCCFEASSSIQKAALVLWCTTDSAGGVGPVFPGLTMPVISLQRAGGRLLCVTPPLCDTSAENVKGEQIPPSNLWGGWTLHPLAMTRGGWKSPLGLVHGDFLSTPPFYRCLCASSLLWVLDMIFLFTGSSAFARSQPLKRCYSLFKCQWEFPCRFYFFPASPSSSISPSQSQFFAFSDCCLTYMEGSYYWSYSQSSWRCQE